MSKKRIKKLAAEQQKENNYRHIRHQIINPTRRSPREKPFKKIKNVKQRAVFILHISGFKNDEIIKATGLKESSVFSYISNSYRNYPSQRTI